MDEELFRAIAAGDLARFRRWLDARAADLTSHPIPLGRLLDPTTRQSLATAAAAGGHVGLLDALWERNVDLSARDGTGRAPLHCAAAWGHVETMQFLRQAGVPLDRRSASGETATHLAAANNRTGVLSFLLEANVDLCLPGANGVTPQHLAAAAGHREAVAVLLRARPEVPEAADAEEAAGSRADAESSDLDEAVRQAVERMDALIASRDESSPRVALAVHRGGRLITPLRGGKADFEVPDDDGNTAAHHAAARGRSAVLRQLLQAGVFLGAHNRSGATPAHEAARCDHLEALQCIEAADPAFLGVQDGAGCTPVQRAAEAGAVLTLQYLIERGHLVPAMPVAEAVAAPVPSESPAQWQTLLAQTGPAAAPTVAPDSPGPPSGRPCRGCSLM